MWIKEIAQRARMILRTYSVQHARRTTGTTIVLQRATRAGRLLATLATGAQCRLGVWIATSAVIWWHQLNQRTALLAQQNSSFVRDVTMQNAPNAKEVICWSTETVGDGNRVLTPPSIRFHFKV